MTMPELKPCPFCGGIATTHNDFPKNQFITTYWVACCQCDAKGQRIEELEDSTMSGEYTSIEAWNTRADKAGEGWNEAIGAAIEAISLTNLHLRHEFIKSVRALKRPAKPEVKEEGAS